MKLAGKVAIVTGSARGIGKAIANKFASEGAAVVVSDINIDEAQQVVDKIKSQRGTALAVRADVATKTDVQNLVKTTLDSFKAVHILVNNAGTTRFKSILKLTEEDWDAVLDVDLKGVFLCTQAVLEYMMKQRYGKIINISSNIALGGAQEQFASYGAAKAGVVQLTRATAVEAGSYGINVNSIAPGLILTDIYYTFLTKEQFEGRIKYWETASALHRVGKPEDIANLALFLASDDSCHITGQVIRCDGGFTGLM